MNELHDEFDAWISAGANEDPPRDVALHASGCDICLRLAASFDALAAVDPGLAPAPPLRAARVSPLSRAPARVARSAAAAVAVVAVSLLAAWAPARQVVRCNPATALREL